MGNNKTRFTRQLKIKLILVFLIIAVAVVFSGCTAKSNDLKALQDSITKETADRKKDIKDLKTQVQELTAATKKEVTQTTQPATHAEGTSTNTHEASVVTSSKPSPNEIIIRLKEGNARFTTGKLSYPNQDTSRILLAAKENQANYAFATVLSCSDSRVPPELIFDTGIMDLFIVRVAGNVADTDEIGSVEYGLAHVNTPVLVVLGHTLCGAVTAVTQGINGEGHALEISIPPLVENIEPAVLRAMETHSEIKGNDIIPYAIEENVWQSIEDIFLKSAAVREMVKAGKVKVVGAIYDLSTGKVQWLSEEKVAELLAKAEANPDRQTQAMAGSE